MVIATFGPTTGWVGKTITFKKKQFILEGYGPVTAQDVMEYDKQGHLVWADSGKRAWVESHVAQSERNTFQTYVMSAKPAYQKWDAALRGYAAIAPATSLSAKERVAKAKRRSASNALAAQTILEGVQPPRRLAAAHAKAIAALKVVVSSWNEQASFMEQLPEATPTPSELDRLEAEDELLLSTGKSAAAKVIEWEGAVRREGFRLGLSSGGRGALL